MTGLIAGGGAFSGLAAVIGASCCVLPIILVNLGVSAGLVGNLSFFAEHKAYFGAATGVLIFAAGVAAFWNGRRPGPVTLGFLIFAILLASAAYILPSYEPALIRWINS